MDSRNVDIFHCEQRTAEWFELKCGVPSASSIDSVVKKLKNGNSSVERENYLYKLVAEKITGELADRYYNLDMERGVELEDEARGLYEVVEGCKVDTSIGFMIFEEIGYSPDGVIGSEGLIEIKCPRMEHHIRTLHKGVVPKQHIAQIQCGLWVSGAKWCDFISYARNAPIFIKRVERDEEYIEKLAKETKIFLSDVEEALADIEENSGIKINNT